MKKTSTDQLHNIPELQAKRLRWLLLLSSLLYVSGIVTPMMTVSQFIVISTTFSVLTGVQELFENGKIILFLLVTVLSILLPAAKLWVLYRLLTLAPHRNHKLQPLLKLMHDYGRWAMLDVMVVAILIVTVKLGTIASVEIHYGLYLFAAAVLLIMFITQRVVTLSNRH